MNKLKLVFICIIVLFTINIQEIVSQVTESIQKMKAIPNLTGIQLGFFENGGKMAYTLEYFGKRPTSRVDFGSWSSMETKKGVYNFDFSNYKLAHNYGETIYGAVNISFSDLITSKLTIPGFYFHSITDADTRIAAKKFLYAYVQKVLLEVGSIVLTIDYEIVSNYKLYAPGSESRAAEWGAWYVEAAVVARQAAADINMSDKLKLMPIVNSDPFSVGNPIFKGPLYNQWLVDVVNVSDFLALDTYQSDPEYPNYSTKKTFDIIKFWIENYAAPNRKDAIVTENGFTSITSIDPTITREDRNMKTTGTEADQATYFQSLLTQLGVENKSDGIFQNRLRSYNIWCIRDNTAKPVGNEDRYFGLVGIDTNGNDYEKPALGVVQKGYKDLETDPFHTPYNVTEVSDVISLLRTPGNNVELNYNDGDDFEFLRYTIKNLPSLTAYKLNIGTTNLGNLVIRVNNNWLYLENQKTFNIDITNYCTPNLTNVIDIYCTNSKFPFVQNVQSVNIESLVSQINTPSQLAKISLFPNPVHSILSILGMNSLSKFETSIFDFEGKLLINSNNLSEIDVSILTSGVYFCKIKNEKETSIIKFTKN